MESNSNMQKAHHIYRRNCEKSFTLKIVAQELKEKNEALYEFLSNGEDCSHLIADEIPSDSDDHHMPEDYWRRYDTYRSTDSKTSYLRWHMENIKPSQVRIKSLKWIVDKYTFITAIIAGRPLCVELFFSDNGGLLLGRYVIALENELKRKGIEYKNYCGLTKKGLETILCRESFNPTRMNGFFIFQD